MSITTLDAAIAGAQPPSDFIKVSGSLEAPGVLISSFYYSGLPGAAAAPTPGLSGEALTSYAGQLSWQNPVSGESRLYRFEAACSQSCTIFLCDRLWHNSDIVVTTTTEQTIDSVAWPARDRNGAVDGEAVLVAIEVRTATTNGGAISNTTLSYTNQDGVGGQTATIASFPATAAIGCLIPFLLADGDTGVQSIQSITLGTSYGGGAIHLVAYRVLSRLGVFANVGAAADFVTGGGVKLYDNTVPFLALLPTSTAATVLQGQLIVTQG